MSIQGSSEQHLWNQVARLHMRRYLHRGHRALLATGLLGCTSFLLSTFVPQVWASGYGYMLMVLGLCLMLGLFWYARALGIRNSMLTNEEIAALTEERERVVGQPEDTPSER